MKKPAEREFVVEINQKAHIGVSPESMLSINLISNRTTMSYSASVEWIFSTLARKFQRENPTGRKRRRFFSSSEELKKYLKEHPGEEP